MNSFTFSGSHPSQWLLAHPLTCRLVERQAPSTMKTPPHPSDREALAGVVERVNYQNAGSVLILILLLGRSRWPGCRRFNSGIGI